MPWEFDTAVHSLPARRAGRKSPDPHVIGESEGGAQRLRGGIQSLRRWIRWRRRAADVGVSVPDPTVLMKGLTRLTKRVMSANPELAFRVSLARNTLLVDSIPNHKTVS